MPKPGKIYLTLDVNYFDDADIIELSDAAQLHDLRAMCLAKRAGTDGRLSRRQLERIAPDSGGESLGEIVEREIWSETEPGAFVRRNWLAWNDSAADIETMSRGGKRGNHVRHHVKGKKPPSAKCEFCVSEGLVSLPDRQATRPPDRQAISPPTPYIDVDTDEDIHENHHPLPNTEMEIEDPRALAERIGEQKATVEEARSQLEREGFDERTISVTLSLLPNLRRAS